LPSASRIASIVSSGTLSSTTYFLSVSTFSINALVTANEILKFVRLYSSSFATANLITSG